MRFAPMNPNRPDQLDHGLQHLWLPPMGPANCDAPLAVIRTLGSRFVLADGRELVDGTALRWVAVHGGNHPHIRAEIQRQLLEMPHVTLDWLVHEQALQLATRLAATLPGGLEHVVLSDSVSAAVDLAVRMAIQYWCSRGRRDRTRIVVFRNSWHGYAFADSCDRHYILDLPRDELTEDALDTFLDKHGNQIAGIIAEPLVQADGGMVFNDELCIARLRQLANRHELVLIFDEIFSGFARTGPMFACETGRVSPDIMVLGGALSGGMLPLAATVATRNIHDAFSTGDRDHALRHGSTYAGNPLACAAANASLDLFESERRCLEAAEIGKALTRGLGLCIDLPGVRDVRVRGAVGVVELERIERPEELHRRFLEAGVWVNLLANTVSLTPSLTTGEEDLDVLTSAVRNVLNETLCL